MRCVVCEQPRRHGSNEFGYCSADCEFADSGDVMHVYDAASAEYIEAQARVAYYIESMRERFRAMGERRLPQLKSRVRNEGEIPHPAAQTRTDS